MSDIVDFCVVWGFNYKVLIKLDNTYYRAKFCQFLYADKFRITFISKFRGASYGIIDKHWGNYPTCPKVRMDIFPL